MVFSKDHSEVRSTLKLPIQVVPNITLYSNYANFLVHSIIELAVVKSNIYKIIETGRLSST